MAERPAGDEQQRRGGFSKEGPPRHYDKTNENRATIFDAKQVAPDFGDEAAQTNSGIPHEPGDVKRKLKFW